MSRLNAIQNPYAKRMQALLDLSKRRSQAFNDVFGPPEPRRSAPDIGQRDTVALRGLPASNRLRLQTTSQARSRATSP